MQYSSNIIYASIYLEENNKLRAVLLKLCQGGKVSGFLFNSIYTLVKQAGINCIVFML